MELDVPHHKVNKKIGDKKKLTAIAIGRIFRRKHHDFGTFFYLPFEMATFAHVFLFSLEINRH